ncbi:unnamed protein product, partial [Amoebophrya sp. A25]
SCSFHLVVPVSSGSFRSLLRSLSVVSYFLRFVSVKF